MFYFSLLSLGAKGIGKIRKCITFANLLGKSLIPFINGLFRDILGTFYVHVIYTLCTCNVHGMYTLCIFWGVLFSKYKCIRLMEDFYQKPITLLNTYPKSLHLDVPQTSKYRLFTFFYPNIFEPYQIP